MALTYRIDAQLLGVWTDITVDVVGDEGVSATRGIGGGNPTDNVADSGGFQFTVDNSALNSGGIAGYYSLDHAQKRAGWTRGVLVRLMIIRNAVEYVRWTGALKDVVGAAGVARGRTAAVIAETIMGTLAAADVRSVQPQIAQNEVAVLNAVLDSLPVASQPIARSFDPALATFAYALHNIGGGTKALSVIKDVVQSALGFAYPLGTNVLRYENLATRQLRQNSYTFSSDLLDAVGVSSGLDGVYNHVWLKAHPKAVDAARVVAWKHTGSIKLDAGQTQTIWGTYQNPSNDEQLIGAFDFRLPLEADVDYHGNSQEDGLGTNLTANLTVTPSAFATSVKMVIQNTSGVTVWIPKDRLQLRGKGIYDRSPVEREAVSVQDYGDRPITIDLPYRDDDVALQAQADYIEASWRSLPLPTELGFTAQVHDDLEVQACEREIGDVITFSESVLGITNVSVFVQQITWDLDQSGLLRVTFALAPRAITDAAHVDELYCADDVTVTITDPPNFLVGSAMVGFSAAASVILAIAAALRWL